MTSIFSTLTIKNLVQPPNLHNKRRLNFTRASSRSSPEYRKSDPAVPAILQEQTMQATPLLHMPASPHGGEPMEIPPRPPAATVPSPDSFLGATPSRVWGVRMIFSRHGRAIVSNFSFVDDLVSCSFSPLSFPSWSLSFSICQVSKGGLTLTEDTHCSSTWSIRHHHQQHTSKQVGNCVSREK